MSKPRKRRRSKRKKRLAAIESARRYNRGRARYNSFEFDIYYIRTAFVLMAILAAGVGTFLIFGALTNSGRYERVVYVVAIVGVILLFGALIILAYGLLGEEKILREYKVDSSGGPNSFLPQLFIYIISRIVKYFHQRKLP